MLRPLAVAAATVAVIAAGPLATTASAGPSVRTTPALHPRFSPAVDDYVVRCTGPVDVRVRGAGRSRVSVDGARGRRGSFSRRVPLAAGRAFRIRVGSGRSAHRASVRCLPPDFPAFSVVRRAPSARRFYLATPTFEPRTFNFVGAYAAIFDHNLVPVWWYREDDKVIDARFIGRRVAWARDAGDYVVRTSDGRLVTSIRAQGGKTDFHDLQRLRNGNWLVLFYRLRAERADLSPYGGPRDARVIDAEIQEITPDGRLAWNWNSKDHIGLEETGRWWSYVLNRPNAGFHVPPEAGGERAYDVAHINSVEPVENGGLVVSLRHTDAVYEISRRTGAVRWKLGGTSRPESLRVRRDPRSYPLGGQHDARVLPDGTLTVYDNRTDLHQPPRAVRYRIDRRARTATFLEQVQDRAVSRSACCGSARYLGDGGGWLVGWGGRQEIGEYRGSRLVFRLTLGNFSYRTVPVPEGVVTAPALRAAMDRLNPR